jgi:phosphoribosyl 1,2-cyclic phosphate phosphodiesterase
LKLTFLGTGTSQGIPLIGCQCVVCLSKDSNDKRLRTSVMIQSETTTVVIDSGPDFRQQMLREDVRKLDGLVFTHSHKDHLAGMDDIRAFNYIQKKDMDVYANEETQAMIKNDFAYIFTNNSYPGIPQVQMHLIDKNNAFTIGDITFLPIEVMHFKMNVLGFRVENLTYITDANFISAEEKQKIIGSDILILNALRREKHISHFTLDEAIEISDELAPKQTYFTHISHQLGLHEEVEKELPLGKNLAYDMLSIEF